MVGVNPYKVAAGPELDQMIHGRVMRMEDQCPSYSTDEKAARRVLARLKSLTGRSIVVGRTALRKTQYFARYETDPSDGTEVLAETLPLAVCRLALLRVLKEESDS
jgi:hypothetical protein